MHHGHMRRIIGCVLCFPPSHTERNITVTVPITKTIRLNDDATKLVRSAADLLGHPSDESDDEYRRGMVELICNTTAMPDVDSDDKRAIIEQAIQSERSRRASNAA